MARHIACHKRRLSPTIIHLIQPALQVTSCARRQDIFISSVPKGDDVDLYRPRRTLSSHVYVSFGHALTSHRLAEHRRDDDPDDTAALHCGRDGDLYDHHQMIIPCDWLNRHFSAGLSRVCRRLPFSITSSAPRPRTSISVSSCNCPSPFSLPSTTRTYQPP